MKNFILFLLLTGTTAFAEPLYIDSTKRILIQSSASCQLILSEVLSPEKKIEEALNVLFSNNDEAKRRQECFDFIVNDWRNQFREHADSIDGYGGNSPKISQYSNEYNNMAAKMLCYNYHTVGSENHKKYAEAMAEKCPMWLTTEEYQELYKSQNALQKKINFEYNKVNSASRVIKNILSQIRNKEKLDASVPFKTIEEISLNYDLFPEFANLEHKILQVSYCYVPDSFNVQQQNNHKKMYDDFCQSNWLQLTEKEKIEDELREQWKDLGTTAKKWDQLKARASDNYSRRKLFALFNAQTKKKNQNFSLKNFCDQQEKDALRDAKWRQHLNYDIVKYSSDSQWRMALEGGLTEAEVTSIAAYTGNYYSLINKAIWNKDNSETTVYFKGLLDTALEKAPGPFYGPVIRMTNLPAAVLEQHKVGEIVTYDAYTSTSKKKNWQWNGNHRFVMYSGRYGKDVSSISSHPSEEEVLFRSGTRFKVISRKEAGGGVIEFVMAEVNEKGEVIAKLPE